MCKLCGSIAHNAAGDDPTRTLQLRNNYGEAWKKRIEKAAQIVIASSLLTSFAIGTIPESTLQNYIQEQLNSQLITDWEQPFVRAAVVSSFVQGSIRLQDEITSDDALESPLFAGSYAAALPFHAESISNSSERTASLMFAGALAARRQAAQDSIDAQTEAIKAEILRVATAGVPPAEAASAADTLVVGTHAESMLNYYEAVGVTLLVAQVEFVTAGDERVCPDCESLAGQTFLLVDSRGIIPVHVGCRCSWYPKLLR